MTAGAPAERFRSQLLAGPPAPDPVAVGERLLAVQAQDLRGARLAVRARTHGLSASDVDRALGDRSLVVSWLNRGTLHMVRSEDYPWLHALTAPRLLTRNARRLSEEGVDADAADRGVAVIEKALAEEGPLGRAALGEQLAAAGIRTEGQALISLLALACLRGVTLRGPVVDDEAAYVLVRDWLGEPAPVDRKQALAELARRYLAGHAPAGEADLAKWSGLPLRDVRPGLKAVGEGARFAAAEPPAAETLPTRLLGPYEPLLLGWASREWVLGEQEGRVVSGGILRAFALVNGELVATWGVRQGEVKIEPFAELRDADAAALRAEAADVERFLAG